MNRRGWWRALALAALLASSVGRAADPAPSACLPVAGGGALTVEGVGRVVFAELATDRVRDAATFGGRVCLAIEGSDVVFRTERLEVAGLAGPLTLAASGVQVDVPGWTLVAAELRGGPGWAELGEVTIVGADAVGLADSMRLEFGSGRLVAAGLRLQTSSLRIDAVAATLDGDVLIADGARMSSCDCPPDEAPLRVDARRVRLTLAAETSAVVEGGMVVAGGVRWPLGEELALDGDTLADLELPLAIGPDPDRAGAWRVALLPREVAPGARASASWTSGAGARPARVGFGLAVRTDDATLALTGASDRLAVDLRGDAALGGGWRLEARQRFEAGAIDEPVRDVALRAVHEATGSGAWGRAAAEVGVLTALTGQTLAVGEVAGPRLGVEARVAWTAPGGAIVPGVDVAGAATAYPVAGAPGAGAQQLWASVTPSVVVRSGGARFEAAHLARWVAGGSPFSARVDRATVAQRSDVAASWSGALPGEIGLEVGASLRYRWDPDPVRAGRRLGLEDLKLRAGASVPVGEATVALGVTAELAGRIDPRPGREAFATVRVVWARDRIEAGVRSTIDLEPGGTWRDVTVFAAVPFDATPAWTWRPYVAIDLLAFAGGSGPWFRGHGLDLTWRTCCGTVELGYRSDAADGASAHFAVVLPVRPLDPTRLAVLPGAR